jgi:hypothetical protein
MNKAINKKAVLDFLDNEIKEVSENWTRFVMRKRTLERAVNKSMEKITAEEQERFDFIQNAVKGRKESKQKEYFEAMSDEDKEIYKNVGKFKNEKLELEKSIEAITPNEDFLEIAQEFKSEVEQIYDRPE